MKTIDGREYVKRRFTVTAYVPKEATDAELADFVYDLNWVGGCREPGENLLFNSIEVKAVRIRGVEYV